MASDHINVLNQLADWLKEHEPNNVLMPLVSKRPQKPHKDGQWTWDDFHRHIKLFPMQREYGILNKTLFCLDFDNIELFYQFRKDHPEWLNNQLML